MLVGVVAKCGDVISYMGFKSIEGGACCACNRLGLLDVLCIISISNTNLAREPTIIMPFVVVLLPYGFLLLPFVLHFRQNNNNNNNNKTNIKLKMKVILLFFLLFII